MLRLTFVLLFLRGCLADEQRQMAGRSIPLHLSATDEKGMRRLHHNNPMFYRKPHSDDDPGLATLTATIQEKSEGQLHHMDVDISWKDIPWRSLTKYDWIGVFDTELMTEFHAPVKYKYVFGKHVGRNDLPNHGNMTLTIWNMRSSYVFIYISGNMQYPDLIAQSAPVKFQEVAHPQMPHIAVKPTDPTKMLVMWTQQNPEKPRLQWGTSPDQLVNDVLAAKDTYNKRDFCDIGVSPAGRQGYFKPGHFATSEMPIEAGKTYYYRVGDLNDGFTKVMNFTAPPGPNADSTRLILFGDMGNAPQDGSSQHSWDFNNRGELPSINTTRLCGHLMDKEKAHGVVHFGDIAYSVGYLSEWDEFMIQIQSVAQRIPWMASIGNHEMGYSKSDQVMGGALRTASDSGGECGVPFLKRFPFAMQKLGNNSWRDASPWYSFDIGSVHFTMGSSEHDFTTNSSQWQWLVSDLKKVDRSKTPWLVVTFHRGMYIASDYDGDTNVAKLLRDHVEPELLKAGVDFYLAGHHHSYQRYCKLNNGTCVDDDKPGIYHIIAGNAGYDHSPVFPDKGDGSLLRFHDDKVWGATYWDFGKDKATMKMMDGATDKVIDTATFKKSTAPAVSIVV